MKINVLVEPSTATERVIQVEVIKNPTATENPGDLLLVASNALEKFRKDEISVAELKAIVKRLEAKNKAMKATIKTMVTELGATKSREAS